MKKNAPSKFFPSSSSQRPLIAPAHSNSEPQDLNMPLASDLRVSEILFVDPSIADIETVLGNLRPEVHAILLDSHVPASRQIAAPTTITDVALRRPRSMRSRMARLTPSARP